MEVRTAATIQEVAATPMSYTSIIIFLFVLYNLHNNSELFFAVFFCLLPHIELAFTVHNVSTVTFLKLDFNIHHI